MRPVCVLFALLLTSSTPPTGAPVLTAMHQELDRSMATFKSQPSPPYFLSYAITETHGASVDGAFGTIRSSADDRRRVLSTDLRVGSARFDNTHQVPGGFPMGFDRYSWTEVPLGDDVAAIRRVLWYDTDRKYKRATEVYAEGKSNAQVAVAPEDSSPDFAIEPPVHHIDAPADIVVDAHQWEDKIRRYTAPFARYGDIYDGAAQMSAESETRWYVNSDGSEIQQSRVYYRLTLYAYTQADDGTVLPRYESFVASTSSGLPDDSTVLHKVDRMITDLHALKNAPVLEAYTAPAILSGRASGVFFHEVFGHRIEGHRQKQEWEGQTFKSKVGEKILPDAFSVTFDPTLHKLGNVELAGSYQYDDEGVESRRVDVVKNGVFQSFLMSRSPIAGFAHSNGHGRAQSGFAPVARQSNLVVASSQPVSHDSLKAMLIALVKQQGKPYGLLFDDIEGGFTITARTIPNAFNVIPVMVYRIYPNGREELVRGADLIGTPLTVFSKIVAADGDTQVFNGICGAESGWVPVSASSPDILISQIEIQKKAKGTDQAPILPVPEAGAQDDVVGQAMRDELARTMSSLKLKQLDKPYFVSYTIGEHQAIEATASYGSLVATDAERHQRQLQVEVRVGDYALDNTNAIAFGRMGLGISMRMLEDANWLPRDDNYREIRRQLWLATDAAYKEALEALAAKRAMLLNRTRTNPLPDFTHAIATHTIDTTSDMGIDQPAIEDLARALSRVATTPTMYESRVVVSAGQMRLRYLNSEGTEYASRRPLVTVNVRASTQAADGMRLADAIGFYARRFDSLPSRDVLAARVGAMVARLDSLRVAPVLDRYNGPVVFMGAAAPAIFGETFAPALVGRRTPIVDAPQAELTIAEMVARGGSFGDKLGGRVLPDFMKVVDDPTATRAGNVSLFGSYSVDDEGVRAQPTVVVDSGMLKTLLTTRNPVEGVDHSTGNRRGFGPSPSNLVVSATNGVADSVLVQQMLALVKRRGLSYGILVRKLGPSPGTEVGPAMFGMMQSRTAGPVRNLLGVYRVYPDGRLELVRGASLTEFGTSAFKDIIAASNTPNVYSSGSIGGLLPSFARMYMAFSSDGGMMAPTSYVVPSLLFDDVSLIARRGSLPRLPSSPPPT